MKKLFYNVLALAGGSTVAYAVGALFREPPANNTNDLDYRLIRIGGSITAGVLGYHTAILLGYEPTNKLY